jgi:mannose-6-phosphate isomerase-like protein (cupin superfamily)
MKGKVIIRNAADVAPVACPCGEARRIITGADGSDVSIHRVTISRDAQKHYHTRLTEYYVILSGEGEMELGDERVAVKAGDVIMIPPGVAHVARGSFEIINVVSPAFDAADEHLAE